MANASIGGLVSGLDTATIISQLMQLEAQPQTRLKTKVSTEQSALAALQALNTKLAALATKAADLSTMSAWTASTAKSSSENVAAVTDSGATAGSVTFSVDQLATRSTAMYAAAATTTAAVSTAGTTFAIDFPQAGIGVQETFDTGDGSLEDIAAEINAKSTRLAATLVRAGGTTTDPTYRLSITSKETGAQTAFAMADASFLGGAPAGSAAAGVDARLTVSGQTLTSASNTVTDLMPGVDVTLVAKPTADVTITVAPDSQALTDKVKAMVDAINAANADIDTLTNYNATTQRAGLLGGDSTLRSVRDQLLSSVIGGVDNTSLATVGIQVDRSGKLTFDADKLKAAYVADPTKVMALFVDNDGAGVDQGVATGLETLGKKFSNSVDGVVTALVKGRTSAIDGLNDAIESWDTRLAVKRSALERQYGALEVALGKLQSQSQWLAGQIGSLPTMSSGS